MSHRTAAANRAISDAWENEQQLVMLGKGTRDWSPEQQRSIMEFGKAYDENGKAFEGHHMKSVEEYPDYQGNPQNIQFLSRNEHRDAHGGNFQNGTNGFYNSSTGRTNEFGDGFEPCKSISLTNPIYKGESKKTLNNNNIKGGKDMSGWEVTEQAVSAMTNMASQMEELTERIHQETQRLKMVFEGNEDGLGHHSSSIRDLIEEVEQTESEAALPVKKLVLKLLKAAKIRQAHIDNNRYGRSR